MPRLNQTDLESCISAAKKEGSAVQLGRKENALREQALILYHERNLSISNILKRLWGILSIDEENEQGKAYWERSSEMNMSEQERNQRLRISRLPILLSWLKIPLEDMEIEE
jgi:hypothetical protein